MRRVLLVLFLLCCLLTASHSSPLRLTENEGDVSAAPAAGRTRERLLMDFDWKFHLGDVSDPQVTQLHYDDSQWRSLNLPHDMVVEGTFSPSADMAHGFVCRVFESAHSTLSCTEFSPCRYLPYQIGVYRKHFVVPSSWRGDTIWIDFDGTYRDTSIWLNGQFLLNHPSGYTSYRVDINNVTALNFGGENVLVVRCDSTKPEGWWYGEQTK